MTYSVFDSGTRGHLTNVPHYLKMLIIGESRGRRQTETILSAHFFHKPKTVKKKKKVVLSQHGDVCL